MPWTNEQMREYRLKRRAIGLCEVCGVSRGEDGTSTRCRVCANKVKDRVAKRRKIVPQKSQIFICINGTCITCNQTNSYYKEYEPCLLCYFHLMAGMYLGSRKRWKEMEKLWYNQNGICPYTGFQLELGIDASIDHILPSSRFPELSQEISNMEFIHYRVNEMKRDWTKEKFLEFLQMMSINLNLCKEESPWISSLYDE